MNLRALLWCWFQSWHLRAVIASPENPIKPPTAGELTKNRTTDLGENNEVIDEFKTLDEDINTVKKLKVMVEVFERIKRENPAAYDRMVRFFDENEKAHRLRRSFLQELRSLGRKTKVEALEQKLDGTVKCHPKSGKELIQMFVRGLSELYPDMTKLLLKELEGAMDAKALRKTTVKRSSAKKVDKKMTTPDVEAATGKLAKAGGTTETCTTEVTCSKCPEPTTICCQACSSTCSTLCAANECETENSCNHHFAGNKEEDEAGDMRIHPTARLCKKTNRLIPKTKAKNPLIENITLTAPFKDFQVQGSIMFSNPNKHRRKSNFNSTSAEDPSVDKARIAETWRGWYPRSDSANVVAPVDGNEPPRDIAQSGQPVKPPKADPSVRSPRHNGDAGYAQKPLENPAIPSNSQPAREQPLPQSIFDQVPESVNEFPRRRNKKRSMYVLYE